MLVFWVNHHYFIAGLKSADRGLLWLNGLFLLCITATPFPTGLVGAYPGTTPPLVLLSLTMCATSLAMALMRYYASRIAHLSHEHLRGQASRTAMLQSGIAPLLYAFAALLSFAWRPGALLVQALVPLIFFLRSPARHEADGMN